MNENAMAMPKNPNEAAKKLIDDLLQIFPGANEAVFKRIIEKRIIDDGENLSNLSETTAQRIKKELSDLTEEQIREILVGALGQ